MEFDKPTGLYGWIQSNDGRSLGLFLTFLLAMQVICAVNLFLPLAVIDPLHAPFLGWGGYLARYAPLMLAGSVAWFGWELFWHIETVKKASGFRFIDNRDEPRLCRIIEPLIMMMGLPIPFVGVIDSPARNAFACGVARKKAVVVVTRGLIDTLSDEELSAVLAHELSHIKNGDIRLMAAANIFMTRLQLLHKNNALRFTPVHVVLALAIPAILPLTLLGTFIGHLVLRAGQVSRLMIASAREFIADAEAVQLTKNPAALASALVKVEHDYRVPAMRREDDAMMIAGDTDGENATHPTVAQRIAALARTTGSMVFNAPGAIPAEQWTSSPTLTEARAAALLRQLPETQVLAHVRAGSEFNMFGLNRNAMIMLAVTVAGLLWIHSAELGNARAMAAKFDVRPLSVMIGAPLACQVAPLSQAADHACDSGASEGAYRDFEGQKNTLAGWLAGVSKNRKANGFVNSDATLGNLVHNERLAEYPGISLRMKGVKALMDGEGMFATGGTTFSSSAPDAMIIAELNEVGCFGGHSIHSEPNGKYRIGQSYSGGGLSSFQDYADRAKSSASQPIIKGSSSADADLRSYVETRKTMLLHGAYNMYGLPGVRALQIEYLSGPHTAMVARLRERMLDPGFMASLTPMEQAEHRALVRDPRGFVPCVALRHLPSEQAYFL